MRAVAAVVWVGGALGAAASCLPGPFACETDAQCTRSGGGQCEAGGACSYPDPDCASGRRYSALGPSLAGVCTEQSDDGAARSTGAELSGSGGAVTDSSSTNPATTVAFDDTGSSTGDGILDDCDEVTCSGNGMCVVVDAVATCACEPGWVMVGTQCLEDPCEFTTCYFVHDTAGDDTAAGTREAPWQTVGRVNTALQQALPGEHFLFRRGGNFAHDGILRLAGRDGAPGAPIVLGAYGPVDAPKPNLAPQALEITDASNIVVRDLAVTNAAAGAGACVQIDASQNVTLHDMEISFCDVRAIRIRDGAEYITVFRNYIHDVGNKTAIFIADTEWTNPPEVPGAHHWVADNIIDGSDEYGIDVLIGSGDGDVKIVGNQVANVVEHGIRATADYAWVIGNTVVAAATGPDDRAAIRAAGRIEVHGNITAASGRALVMAASGSATMNTLVQTAGTCALCLSPSPDGMEVYDNLVVAIDVPAVVVSANPLPVDWLVAMDRNVYAATLGGDCTLRIGALEVDFPTWQAQSGYDTNGRCEPVPGVGETPTGAAPPFDAAVWDAVTPDADWPPCATVGAVDCDGARRPAQFAPFPALGKGEGKGWDGPLLIRQLYPL